MSNNWFNTRQELPTGSAPGAADQSVRRSPDQHQQMFMESPQPESGVLHPRELQKSESGPPPSSIIGDGVRSHGADDDTIMPMEVKQLIETLETVVVSMESTTSVKDMQQYCDKGKRIIQHSSKYLTMLDNSIQDPHLYAEGMDDIMAMNIKDQMNEQLRLVEMAKDESLSIETMQGIYVKLWMLNTATQAYYDSLTEKHSEDADVSDLLGAYQAHADAAASSAQSSATKRVLDIDGPLPSQRPSSEMDMRGNTVATPTATAASSSSLSAVHNSHWSANNGHDSYDFSYHRHDDDDYRDYRGYL